MFKELTQKLRPKLLTNMMIVWNTCNLAKLHDECLALPNCIHYQVTD